LNPDLTFDRVFSNFSMLHKLHVPVLPLAVSAVLFPIISHNSSYTCLFSSVSILPLLSSFGSNGFERLPETLLAGNAISARLKLTLSDVRAADGSEARAACDEIERGRLPDFGFQGTAKTKNGYAQKVAFRSVIPAGSFDVFGLAGDGVDIWEFIVNAKESDTEMLKEKFLV
jgi:hypothetical protein